MIDFPVQVSDKPKGIAVGAAKECVHTLSRVFYALKTSREQRMMTLVQWEPTHTLKKRRERQRERKRERKEDGYTQSDPAV